MVAHHPQHRLSIGGELWERAHHRRHLCRGRVGVAGQNGGEGPGHRPAFVRVVGQPHPHENAAQVGVAEAQGAVVVGALGDLAGGEMRHRDGDLQHDRPQVHGVGERVDVEDAGLVVVELAQVQARQVAGRVVQVYELRARVGGVDPPPGR